MADDSFPFEDILNLAPMLGLGAVSLSAVVSAYPKLVEEIKQFDPVKSATVFSGLLTEPDLQSNCYRLETLVHLVLAVGNGTRKPSLKNVIQWFSALDEGPCGSLEDPSEDVFVKLVSTPKGNFRILEGIWESSGFYLQKVLDTVERMPDGTGYNQIRNNIYALLKLSDLVCDRAKLQRNQLGNATPVPKIPSKFFNKISSLQHRITFTASELETIGIDLDDLVFFGFLPENRQSLLKETIGHTYLERFPVTFKDGKFQLLLPTAVSAAIRRLVFEKMNDANMRHAFLAGLAREYANWLTKIPVFGRHSGVPISFERTSKGLMVGVMERVDAGRYLNMIYFVDTLEEFDKTGLSGLNPDPELIVDDIDIIINDFLDIAKKEPDFKECLTVLVGCGIGRGQNYVVNKREDDRWRFLFLSAADLYSLSGVIDFKLLSLWRIIDAQKQLKDMSVTLLNVNGFLNLVAWIQSLNGHLVPHGDLPNDFGVGASLLHVDQNIFRNLRHEVLNGLDYQRIPDINGQFISVNRCVHDSLFDEDRRQPIYAGEQYIPGHGIPAVYMTSKRPWWVKMDFDEEMPTDYKYDKWRMLTIWLSKSAPLLDDILTGLPMRPLLWHVSFESSEVDINVESKKFELESAISAINVHVDHSLCTVNMSVNKEFQQAFFHPENIAERAIVIRMVDGFIELSGDIVSSHRKQSIIDSIVPNNLARQSHVFQAREFRDFVRESVRKHPITIDSIDAASVKLGVGWRVRDRADGPNINGKEDCISFLNSTVSLLQEELCNELKKYDRKKLISLALENHESACMNREWWRKTTAAVISLRQDQEEAKNAIAMHEYELNAVFQGTRLIIEMAICECPIEGGECVGQLELSRLMAKVLQISQFGGCSDAIHWDTMEPKIIVTPLGDIYLNFDFFDQVMAPFGRVGIEEKIKSSISDYSKHMDAPDILSTKESLIEHEFLDAWKAEIGVTIDDMQKFVGFIEDQGIQDGKAVLVRPMSAFLPTEGDVSQKVAKSIIERMMLTSRPSWRDVPEDYEDRDIQLWRFRRRLSVLRKPFIQLDENSDPTLVVAPGLLRDSFSYMFSNYYRGDFPGWQFRSREMKSWVGKSMHKRGNEFSKLVGDKLTELGWNVEVEQAVTKLLRKGFEKNYGDIDVLAWSDTMERVLLIECKDVQYRKTPGEIAEQLTDFRGEYKDNGKPDFLRKHLDRVDLISEHVDSLYEFIGAGKSYRVEGHLVFKNAVPMQYAWGHMKEACPISVHSDLDEFYIAEE